MDKKPTPIPLRASRKKSEPKPDRSLTVVPAPLPPNALFDEEIQMFVQQCVTQALRDERRKTREEMQQALDNYSANLYHTLDRSEVEIIEMGEAQFQALMRDVWRTE